LSVLGNILFVLVLILGYLESNKPTAGEFGEDVIPLTPDLVQRAQGPLYFGEAAAHSELAEMLPNAIYVVSDRTVRARFEFVDQKMSEVSELTVFDKYGRPWINADLDEGKMIYSRYTGEYQSDVPVSLLDDDGDGIPDVMVDWNSKTSFVPLQEFSWTPMVTDVPSGSE